MGECPKDLLEEVLKRIKPILFEVVKEDDSQDT
jgi:hypothetical protein